MVPCIGTVTWPLPAPPPRGRPAAGAGAGRGRPGRSAAAGGDHRRHVGHPQPDLEAPAVDLHVDVALHPGLLVVGGCGRRRGGAAIPDRSSRCSTQLVECSTLMKSGCSRMAMSAGMVVAGPSISVSPKRPQHAVPGFFAVAAPDDDLGDEVVVELADGVALVVAGVGADPEAVRPAKAG